MADLKYLRVGGKSQSRRSTIAPFKDLALNYPMLSLVLSFKNFLIVRKNH